MTVVWGDGQVNRGISASCRSHPTTTAGDYVVQVTGGLTAFNLNYHVDAPKMISIDQWGNASWTTMKDAFQGASSMSYHATDAPDLSSMIDMSSMFNGAASFNGDISSWNVSSATNMTDMFTGAGIFEQNLGEWYIVPDSTFIAGQDVPGVVGSISAQNGFLENHNATYGIGTGGYSALFEIVSGNDLRHDFGRDKVLVRGQRDGIRILPIRRRQQLAHAGRDGDRHVRPPGAPGLCFIRA